MMTFMEKNHPGVVALALGALIAAALLTFASTALAAPPATGSSDLAVTKTGPATATVGSTITYEIQVSNVGPDAATGVTVTDQLPKGTDYSSVKTSAGTCSASGNKITCALGNMAVDSAMTDTTATITLAVKATKAGTVTNEATVKADQADPVATNDKASAKTTVTGPAPVPTCQGFPVTLKGTAGADELTGTSGRDVVAAYGGSDSIVTFSGSDIVCAGKGSDYVQTGRDGDRVAGADGADRLIGRGGNDKLVGGAGNDVLVGNGGFDRLLGGFGFDRCRPGAGGALMRSCEG